MCSLFSHAKCRCSLFVLCPLLLFICGDVSAIPPQLLAGSQTKTTEIKITISIKTTTSPKASPAKKKTITPPKKKLATQPPKKKWNFGSHFTNWDDWDSMEIGEDTLLNLTDKEKKQLKSVWLRYKFTDKSILALCDMPNVKQLWIGDCPLVTEKGLLLISKMKNLEEFHYHVAYRKRYKENHLPVNSIPALTAKVMREIAKLKHLKSLDLASPYLTDKCFSELRQAKRLEKLQISGQKHFTKKTFQHFSEMNNLRSFSYNSNGWHGEGLEQLKQITHLRLAHNSITDKDLIRLEGLQQLKSLDLEGTKITDAGLASVAKLKNLESLSLWDTEVTPKALVHIRKLKKLTYLNAQDTPGWKALSQYINHGKAELKTKQRSSDKK